MQEKLPNYVVPDLTDFKVCIFHSFNLIAIFFCCSPVFLQHTMLTITWINSLFNSLSFIGIVWVSYGYLCLNFSSSPYTMATNMVLLCISTCLWFHRQCSYPHHPCTTRPLDRSKEDGFIFLQMIGSYYEKYYFSSWITRDRQFLQC